MPTLDKIKAEIIEEYKKHQIDGWEKLAIEIIDKHVEDKEKRDRELIRFILLFYSEEVYEKRLEDEAYEQWLEWRARNEE